MHKYFLTSFIIVSVFMSLTLSSAQAEKKVYINGMDMSKYLLTNITLKCVTVKFDGKGNIFIIADGYNFSPSKTVKTTEPDKVDKLANKYYLVTFPKPAKVNIGFDIDVIVNGKF
ncbi:hypothetical protein KKF84_16590, partial [Myxococcota bacterium]|nr:hypothetical protein [Myxococcota bacterium]MBU1536943.1 hypothetical protein [Myxococcota bacterium]